MLKRGDLFRFLNTYGDRCITDYWDAFDQVTHLFSSVPLGGLCCCINMTQDKITYVNARGLYSIDISQTVINYNCHRPTQCVLFGLNDIVNFPFRIASSHICLYVESVVDL